MTSKIYTRELTSVNGEALQMAAGVTDRCFIIQFPHEFMLTDVACVHDEDASGSLAGFDFVLYNRLPSGCAGLVDEDDASESIEPGGLEPLARVIPVQSASGSPLTVRLTNDIYRFRNVEGTFTVPEKRIFARIFNLTGNSGAQVFEVSLTGHPATP